MAPPTKSIQHHLGAVIWFQNVFLEGAVGNSNGWVSLMGKTDTFPPQSATAGN